MSIILTTEFFNKIQILLKQDNYIATNICDIYTQPILDPDMPCIVIEIEEIKNLSSQFQNIYEFEFYINLLIKDNLSIQTIADKIIKILVVENFALSNFETTGIYHNNMKFIYSKDRITTKLQISYKALIKKEII
jgi:hypothetical protein